MYLDQHGLIVQQNMDGGDSAQRMGFFYATMQFRALLGCGPWVIPEGMASFPDACKTLSTPKGFIRNPVQWNDPKDFSRDQARPMMIAAGTFGMKDVIEALKPKWGFYQNYDIASPENWNEYNRAIGMGPSDLGDAWNYAGVVIRCRQAAKNPDDVGDDLNCLLTTVFFYMYHRTCTAEKSLKYFLQNRPKSNGKDPDNVIAALQWYFRPESGGNYELAEMWREPIVKLRGILGINI